MELEKLKIRIGKLTVYTAIFGDYDVLKDPLVVNPNITYICFTDNEEINSDIWDIRLIKRELSPRREARKYKILSHKYIDTEMSLWIDGSCQLIKNPITYINKSLKTSSFVLSNHPRNCLYKEGEKCIVVKKGDPDKIREQLNRYKEENYPEDNGLVDTTVLLRKMNSEVIKIENDWWNEICNGCVRDQVSFNYIAWKNNFKYGIFKYQEIVLRNFHNTILKRRIRIKEMLKKRNENLMKKKIGIVVVMHKSKLRPNGFALINNYINTLYKYCKRNFILYLIDNSSIEDFDIPNYDNIKYSYVEDQMKRGVTGAWNDGVKKAITEKCDTILITNDDILFNETVNNFIDAINLHKFNRIGLYAPLTNGVMKGFTLQEGVKPGKGILETTNKTKWILNGFFMGFTKEFYKKFRLRGGNLFRERYKWGRQESDLQRRIKPNGGRMFVIRSCWIYHKKIRGWVNFK